MDRRHEGGSAGATVALVDEHLAHFVAHAAATLGRDVSCSITMRWGEDLRRSASTDPRSAACDDAEVASGTGPCIEAMGSGRVVMVDDVRARRGSEGWVEAAVAAGFVSSGAFPGHGRTGTAVAVNVYRPFAGPWELDAVVRADLYAQEAARVLDLCRTIDDIDAERRALADALTAQRLIDRAIGVVMATHRCDARTALRTLQGGATAQDVELTAVATTVLDTLEPPAL